MIRDIFGYQTEKELQRIFSAFLGKFVGDFIADPCRRLCLKLVYPDERILFLRKNCHRFWNNGP